MSTCEANNTTVRVPQGYRIVERFPVTSAFKEVFKAVRITSIGEMEVVLKRYQCLSSDEMKSLMEKFHMSNEYQILAKDAISQWAGGLRHPNLLPCDIIANDAGENFIVEPLLDTTMDKCFPRTYEEFLTWVEGLLAGVRFLHQKEYIHSDIKPDNMGLYCGTPVLLDFGIASKFGEFRRGKKNPGSIKTRPPELFGGDVIPTPASDMWSLGASFYFMLTKGDYPFLLREEVVSMPPAGARQRQKFEETVRKRAEAAIQDPDAFDNSIASKLMDRGVLELFRHLLRSCLKIQPDDRSSASRLLSWLDKDGEYFYRGDFVKIFWDKLPLSD